MPCQMDNQPSPSTDIPAIAPMTGRQPPTWPILGCTSDSLRRGSTASQVLERRPAHARPFRRARRHGAVVSPGRAAGLGAGFGAGVAKHARPPLRKVGRPARATEAKAGWQGGRKAEGRRRGPRLTAPASELPPTWGALRFLLRLRANGSSRDPRAAGDFSPAVAAEMGGETPRRVAGGVLPGGAPPGKVLFSARESV
ncbi:uncharacterized protein ACOB8E_023852 [Sarcophilus harrisii]